MSSASKPLAILSALPEEQAGLLEQLVQPRSVVRAGREFWTGLWHGQPVVLGLSRIGKVAAATTAVTLIEALGVDRIVFTGVAGGVGPAVEVGDVVVADAFVQHDMDASPLFPRYQVPLYGQERFATDPSLSAILFEAGVSFLTSENPVHHQHLTTGVPQIHRGLIASGDRFVSAAQEQQVLMSALADAGHAPLAVEMEGAAVAQVCHDYGVPFAAMRTISDRADDAAHADFPRFVTEVASRYALCVLSAFVRALPAR